MSVELDVQVATEIMGYRDNWDEPESDGVWEPVHIWNKVGILPVCPMYSSDMNAALDVIDELNNRNITVNINQIKNSLTEAWQYLVTVENSSSNWTSVVGVEHPAKLVCQAALQFLEKNKSGAV